MRILIVDDNAVNRKLLRVIIESMRDVQTEIIDAVDGDDALDKYCGSCVSKTPFDIMFMDMMMPNHSGVWSAKHIMDCPKSNHPKIVFVTAFTEIKDMIPPEYEVVTKPIDAVKIREIIYGQRRT